MKWVFAAAILASMLALCRRGTAACEAPPHEQRVGYRELISRTARIVLAKAEAYDRKAGRYRFTTIEALKGAVPAEFLLAGFPPEFDSPDLVDHHDPDFFKGGGRSTNSTDCKIHPTFAPGRQYLVFLDEPYHTKSFEEIPSLSDPWLKTVRKRLKKKG